MEILVHKNYEELLRYLPHIKSSLHEWLFIDVRLAEDSDQNFTVSQAAELVGSLFKNKDGKIYVCNDREILVLLHSGKDYVLSEITRTVERHLPEGSCKVSVHEPTPEGLAKVGILITYKKTAKKSDLRSVFSDIRHTRRENVILVADDDLYMRTLVKKGLAAHATVHEAANGDEIAAAYKKCTPDILFLDIHMPNVEGTEVLGEILKIDPTAYIVMLSADSSRENVEWTAQHGAKGFLTKPFTKDKLVEYIKKCPTIS